MKKTLITLCLVLMLIIGCGSGSDAPTNDEAPEATEEAPAPELVAPEAPTEPEMPVETEAEEGTVTTTEGGQDTSSSDVATKVDNKVTEVTSSSNGNTAQTVEDYQNTGTVQANSQLRTGECGDGMCNDLSGSVEGQVSCDSTKRCTLGGEYTENAFSCPVDCGIKCDEKVVIGAVSKSGCLFGENDVTLTIKNSGRGNVSGGMKFYIYSMDGGITVEETSESLPKGETKEYVVSTEGIGSANIKQVLVMPRTVVDGNSVTCSNQRMVYTGKNCASSQIRAG